MRVLPRLFVDCIKLGLARQRRINPQDSIGVTDNDRFAFLSHQPGIDEMDFLPKTALSRNG